MLANAGLLLFISECGRSFGWKLAEQDKFIGTIYMSSLILNAEKYGWENFIGNTEYFIMWVFSYFLYAAWPRLLLQKLGFDIVRAE